MSWIKQISSEIKSLPLTERKIREFLVLFVVISVGIGVWYVVQNSWEASSSIIIFAFLLLSPIFAVGFIFPMLYKTSYLVWMGLAVTLGFFMSSIIIGLVFYLVITPIGIVKRLTNKDFLDERWNSEEPSYWKERKGNFTKESFEKLY